MDQLMVVPGKKECWICFNDETNSTLTTVNSDRMLKNCETYLDTAIKIKSFDKEIVVSCCKLCCDSVYQLTLLQVQIDKLQEEISDLSLTFSKNVLDRRHRLKDQNNESAVQATLPGNTSLTSRKNSKGHSNAAMRKAKLKQKMIVPDPLLLDSHQFENVTEGNCETVTNPDDAIDVKYHYEESVSKVVGAINKIIVPSQPISATIANNDQEKTTPMAGLLKSVKLPIIQVKKLQFGESSKTTAVHNACCDIKSEAQDTDTGGSSRRTESKDHPNENAVMNNNSYIAGEEPKQLLKKKNFRKHKQLSSEKHHVCHTCGKSFRKPFLLKVHERIHTGEKPFSCSFCPKSFRRAYVLKRHEISHLTEKPFKCSFCEKSFASPHLLKSHKTLHTGEQPFKCSRCSKPFISRQALEVHEKCCGEKPFICTICHKSYKNEVDLDKHKIFHSREKPYKCSFCTKSFVAVNQANRHEKIHTGEKPYKCSFCPKSFVHSSDAKRHEIIHTEERPYKRLICENTFRQKHHSTEHERKHDESTDEFILP